MEIPNVQVGDRIRITSPYCTLFAIREVDYVGSKSLTDHLGYRWSRLTGNALGRVSERRAVLQTPEHDARDEKFRLARSEQARNRTKRSSLNEIISNIPDSDLDEALSLLEQWYPKT